MGRWSTDSLDLGRNLLIGIFTFPICCFYSFGSGRAASPENFPEEAVHPLPIDLAVRTESERRVGFYFFVGTGRWPG